MPGFGSDQVAQPGFGARELALAPIQHGGEIARLVVFGINGQALLNSRAGFVEAMALLQQHGQADAGIDAAGAAAAARAKQAPAFSGWRMPWYWWPIMPIRSALPGASASAFCQHWSAKSNWPAPEAALPYSAHVTASLGHWRVSFW